MESKLPSEPGVGQFYAHRDANRRFVTLHSQEAGRFLLPLTHSREQLSQVAVHGAGSPRFAGQRVHNSAKFADCRSLIDAARQAIAKKRRGPVRCPAERRYIRWGSTPKSNPRAPKCESDAPCGSSSRADPTGGSAMQVSDYQPDPSEFEVRYVLRSTSIAGFATAHQHNLRIVTHSEVRFMLLKSCIVCAIALTLLVQSIECVPAQTPTRSTRSFHLRRRSRGE